MGLLHGLKSAGHALVVLAVTIIEIVVIGMVAYLIIYLGYNAYRTMRQKAWLQTKAQFPNCAAAVVGGAEATDIEDNVKPALNDAQSTTSADSAAAPGEVPVQSLEAKHQRQQAAQQQEADFAAHYDAQHEHHEQHEQHEQLAAHQQVEPHHHHEQPVAHHVESAHHHHEQPATHHAEPHHEQPTHHHHAASHHHQQHPAHNHHAESHHHQQHPDHNHHAESHHHAKPNSAKK